MKLRNLIFALFLVIGAIGFTACTGDDGAQGPPGPAGPQGPPGDTAEPAEPGDSGDVTAYYDFLKSWGSEMGDVACNDPILTGSGPFPGDGMVELEAITATARTEAVSLNGDVKPTCAEGLFVAATAIDFDGDEDSEGSTVVNELLFYKTVRGAAQPEVVNVAGTEFNQPTRNTTTKAFVGGYVGGTMNSAADEYTERQYLYNNCGIGTLPNIRGTWRAVEIVTSSQQFVNGVGGDSTVSSTTLKVCVALNSIPGTTKCFVRITDANGTTEQVALYDGANLHPVEGKGPMDLTPADPTADFFADVDEQGAPADVSDIAANALCHLFDEGVDE